MKSTLCVHKWDSPRSAFKLILGLFLFIGLFSFFTFGIRQIHTLQVIPGAGYREVTGTVGNTTEYTYYGSGDTGARIFYYYTLLSKDDTRSVQFVVLHHETTHYFLSSNIPELPQKGQEVRIRGNIGVENIPSEVQKKLFGEKNVQVPVLVSNSAPLDMKTILWWFIPVCIGFFLGFFFIFQWIMLVVKQVAFVKKM